MKKYNGRLIVASVCPQCGVSKNVTIDTLKKILKGKTKNQKCNHCENEYFIKL